MPDNYKRTGFTSSGWVISTDNDAPPEKRWRIEHPGFGTRYFAKREDILPFTAEHMAKQIAMMLGEEDTKGLFDD